MSSLYRIGLGIMCFLNIQIETYLYTHVNIKIFVLTFNVIYSLTMSFYCSNFFGECNYCFIRFK